MKALSLKSVVFVFAVLFTMSFSAKAEATPVEGNSNTWLGNYTLVPSQKAVSINGKEYQAWILTYEKGGQKVIIAIDKKKKGENFIVKTDRFEMEYTNSEDGVGVKQISPSYATIDNDRNYGKVDDTQFGYQKKLTIGIKEDNEVLGIIACYFPRLLKKEYQYVLN